MSQAAPVRTPTAQLELIHKRRIRNYLLNMRYQLRFTGVIVVISLLLTGGMGWLVYHFLREASRVVYMSAMLDASETAQELSRQLAHHDRMLLLALVGFGILLCVVLAAYGIVITHKVAGPLFKISVYMHRIRDGYFGKVNELRRGDHLTDFYDDFRKMHDALTQRTRDEIEALDKAVTDAERAGAKGAVDILRAMIKRKTESLT